MRIGLTLLKLFEMLLFLGRISGIFVAGGIGRSVDFLTGNLRIKQLLNLPDRITWCVPRIKCLIQT